jgi:hypothetical protein
VSCRHVEESKSAAQYSLKLSEPLHYTATGRMTVTQS